MKAKVAQEKTKNFMKGCTYEKWVWNSLDSLSWVEWQHGTGMCVEANVK
jgi:hypothetical protein